MAETALTNTQTKTLATRTANPVDGWVMAWLDAKQGKSGSVKTFTAYRDGLADFRDLLHQVGLDLDGAPGLITTAAQGWAGQSKKGEGRNVAPSTYNQRLAILGSFYEFCIAREWLTKNPVKIIERRTVYQYSGAQPLDANIVKRKLAAIDRSTLLGARDFALLSVALKTGRRLSELAGLRWADLLIVGEQITVTFHHAKGGKEFSDKLTAGTSKALLEYLYLAYGHDLGGMKKDAPVWVSLSNRTKGEALSIQAIADVCEARLGVKKVHALRHTFAHTMEEAGASASEIQSRLGHESLQTTGRYLAALRKAENKRADALDELFGV